MMVKAKTMIMWTMKSEDDRLLVYQCAPICRMDVILEQRDVLTVGQHL